MWCKMIHLTTIRKEQSIQYSFNWGLINWRMSYMITLVFLLWIDHDHTLKNVKKNKIQLHVLKEVPEGPVCTTRNDSAAHKFQKKVQKLEWTIVTLSRMSKTPLECIFTIKNWVGISHLVTCMTANVGK